MGGFFYCPNNIKDVDTQPLLVFYGVYEHPFRKDIPVKKNKRLVLNIFLICAIACIGLMFSAFMICWHQNVVQTIVVEPGCLTQGLQQTRCSDCDKILEEIILDEIGHDMGEYAITQQPYQETNGIQTRYCQRCEYSQSIEYICPHINTYMELTQPPTCSEQGIWNQKCQLCELTLAITHVTELPHPSTSTNITKEPSCTEEGLETESCDVCSTIVNEIAIEQLDHSYGNWNYTKWATPINSGNRVKYCTMCECPYEESYTMSMPASNSIYIPGTGICGKLTVTTLTQGTVDSYDMVYEYGYYNHNGPMILGHNYRSFGNLHKTKVGQYIYISINGELTTYKVTISEYALQNDSHTNIYGQSSGVNLWTETAPGTLKMYTCYGGGEGRWLVFAERVG